MCTYTHTRTYTHTHTHTVFLPVESHWQRNLGSYGPWGHKEWNMTERLTLSFLSYIYVCVCVYIYIYIHVFFFRFFSSTGYYNILNTVPYAIQWGFPRGSDGKESAYSVGDLGSIHGLGRFPGKWNGYPLQYSCLEKPWT